MHSVHSCNHDCTLLVEMQLHVCTGKKKNYEMTPSMHMHISECSSMTGFQQAQESMTHTGYQLWLTSSSWYWCLPTAIGSASSYRRSPLRVYMPSRSLWSVLDQHLLVPSQKGTKLFSQMFSITVGMMFPSLSEQNPWQYSRNSWKLISSMSN